MPDQPGRPGRPCCAAAARDFFGSNDVLALIDVDAQIAAMRADERTWQLPSGEEVPAPYGSEFCPTPDGEYQQAVSRAAGEAFAAALRRQGIELGADGAYDSYEGETLCPGDGLPARLPGLLRTAPGPTT